MKTKARRLKKAFAVIMALAVVLSYSMVPTFAATSVTISGFEKGVKPIAHKIADVTSTGAVERAKDANKNVIITESIIKDLEKPQSGEIMKLAANIPSGLDTTEGQVSTGTDITLPDLDPGIYLVTFQPTKDVKYIYNPVIISVDKDGKEVIGSLDEYGRYDTPALTETKVKKSTVPFEKVVERTDSKLPANDKGSNVENGNTINDEAKVDADPQSGNDGNRGDTAAKGETVSFRINTKVPAYADNFFTDTPGTKVTVPPQFQIYDTLDGLTLKQASIKVYANNNFSAALTEGTDYTLEKSDTGFTVKLTQSAIKAYRGKDIEVRYSATVNDNAARVNFNPDSNTAGCKYSNTPGQSEAGLTETEKRTTYHYKFTINGQIEGNSGEWNREVIKVGLDENGEQILMETETGEMTQKGWQPLDGVTFKLYNADQSKVVCDNVISEDGGVLKNMSQLDAGVYYLVEDQTQAAFTTGAYKDKNYSPNTNPIKIEIKAKLLDDGRLDSYMVLVKDKIVGHYKADYTNDYTIDKGTMTFDKAGSFYEISDTTLVDGDGAKIQHEHNIKKPDGSNVGGDWGTDYGVAADIVNTKVGTLPSTGGMGTMLFTVAGIALMAIAAGLFLASRRRNAEEE